MNLNEGYLMDLDQDQCDAVANLPEQEGHSFNMPSTQTHIL